MSTKSPLGQLINSARAPEKLSLQDVADRATKRGFDMSKQNVSRLANDYPLVSISGSQIRGLALALGISERRVAAAALQALGLQFIDEVTPLRQAVLDSVEVGERTKRTLLAILNEAIHHPDPNDRLTQDDVEFAARDRDIYGNPIPRRGRKARQEQDDDATSSQDTGGMDPA